MPKPTGEGEKGRYLSKKCQLSAAGHVSTSAILRDVPQKSGVKRAIGDGRTLALLAGMFRDTAGHEDLTERIIECGIRVHEELGPGIYESIYKTCLLIELHEAGFPVELGRRVPVRYRGRVLEAEFCPDIIVAEVVIVELKAVERLGPIHTAQLLTYLKITELPVGLLMNFNVPFLRQGIRRVVRPDLYVKK